MRVAGGRLFETTVDVRVIGPCNRRSTRRLAILGTRVTQDEAIAKIAAPDGSEIGAGRIALTLRVRKDSLWIGAIIGDGSVHW